MKIFVNARFLTQPVSGVQRYAIECSRQIKKLYQNVTFISPVNIIHNDLATELGAVIIGRNKGHLWEQADLPAYMAKQKGAPLLNLANTAPLLYGNNYITIHDLAFYHHPEWNSKKFSAWYNILIPRLAYKSRYIFTVSQTVKKEIADSYGISLTKISVTYNGISQAMVTAVRKGQTAKEKIILSVGTFSKRKNHQNLVSAFLDSRMKNEYRLAIIGDKSNVFAESNLDEQMLAGNNIDIYTHLSEKELIAMYLKAEIVVSLSLYEGFGIPVLEGLYHGCKIVCSDIPVYRELYNGHAHFCDPLDIRDVEKALVAASNERHITVERVAVLLEQYSYECSAKTIIKQMTGL